VTAGNIEIRADRIDRLAAAQLYLVCDSLPGGRELSAVLPGAIAGGVDVVQLRDKRLDDEWLLAAAHDARELCDRYGALFIVNDRPPIARECEADGVHVGQDDMPVARVRELVGPDMLIGLSTHAPAEIDAVSAGNAGPGDAGIELVRYAAAHASVPWFAIGGLDAHNLGEVLAAGARRVCVLRAIADAADPELAARELRQALLMREAH